MRILDYLYTIKNIFNLSPKSSLKFTAAEKFVMELAGGDYEELHSDYINKTRREERQRRNLEKFLNAESSETVKRFIRKMPVYSGLIHSEPLYSGFPPRF